MKIGVPVEQFPGEHRVALVPASIAPLKKAGFDVIDRTRRRRARGFSRQRVRRTKARRSPRAAPTCLRADVVLQVRVGRSRADAPGAGRDRHGRSARLARDGARHRLARRHRVRARADSAHHARAEHGRAVVDGDDRRLQGRAARGQHAAADVPAADDRRRHDHARARLHRRRRRRRSAGDCHRPQAGRGRRGLRRAAGREGAGAERRREVRRAAARDRHRRKTRAATRRRRTRRSISGSAR